MIPSIACLHACAALHGCCGATWRSLPCLPQGAECTGSSEKKEDPCGPKRDGLQQLAACSLLSKDTPCQLQGRLFGLQRPAPSKQSP